MAHSIRQCPNRIGGDPLEALAAEYFSHAFGKEGRLSENAPKPFVRPRDRWEIRVVEDKENPDRWTIEGALWRHESQFPPEQRTWERSDADGFKRPDEKGFVAAAAIRCNIDASMLCECGIEE